ncbi:Glucans biosynthesis protein C [Kordia antarctica]|uniref:Glucans biosynthesis protein C n=1 Tax=Kordia antarctica TaxID=1218801 RepID=A0A7L4ZR67_9FLAO|nr:acyltransferase family protein [Kordia antarctica]QHI38979.1 Glucans biosynthesis protein C [Kordia antarctica]
MEKTTRIHSLDSLRAIMMLLGILLHSAVTYNVTDHGEVWNLKDPESTHIATDFLVLLIHSFRMPIFFLIAGFFGAMLFYERKPFKMIQNRVSRIVFPFVVFLLILTPILGFVFRYSNFAFSGLPDAFAKAIAPFTEISSYLPNGTAHLWFLYYLIYTTGFSVLLALLMKRIPKVTSKITKVFDWIIQKPFVRIVFFSGIMFAILSVLKTPMIAASTSLIPNAETFICYLFFYIVGWILYKSKQHLDTIMHYDWLCVILGIILVISQGVLIQYSGLDLKPTSNSSLLILFSALIVWLFIFGITGLFIRYGSKHSARMRYISDASYWVYLIHLPLTIILPIAVWKLPIGAIPKFLLVTFLTTVICFVTYHFFVRNTFIGKFLNGRKYAKNKK